MESSGNNGCWNTLQMDLTLKFSHSLEERTHGFRSRLHCTAKQSGCVVFVAVFKQRAATAILAINPLNSAIHTNGSYS